MSPVRESVHESAECPWCHRPTLLLTDGTLAAHMDGRDRPCHALWPNEPNR